MDNETINAIDLDSAVKESVDATEVASSNQVISNSYAATDSVDDVIKRLTADKNNSIVNTIITNVRCELRASRAGENYMNAWLTIESPIPAAKQLPDGTHVIGTLGAFQTPFNSILLVLRKDTFYGRYSKYIAEASEIDTADLYLAGVPIRILCQYVAAGAQERNPFSRKENLYEVTDYDRYVYHIIGIGTCQDPITLDNYRELNKQIAVDARAALLAKRNAKAAVENMLSKAAVSTDMPF